MSCQAIGRFFLSLFERITAWLVAAIVAATGGLSVANLVGDEYTPSVRPTYVFDRSSLLLGAWTYSNPVSQPDTPRLAHEAGLDFIITSNGVSQAQLDAWGAQDVGVIGVYNAGVYNEGYNAATYKSHPALWGDYFTDEPNASAMPLWGERVARYNQLDTGRVPFINLFPQYATNEQLGNEPERVRGEDEIWRNIVSLLAPEVGDSSLDQYLGHIADYVRYIDTDYICYDSYPYGSDFSGRWLTNLQAVAEACRDYDKDLWIVSQATTHPESGGFTPSLPEQRQQGYSALAFGAKAIVYALLQGGWWTDQMLDASGNTTPMYDAVKQANAELAVLKDVYANYKWVGAYTENANKVVGGFSSVGFPGHKFQNELPIADRAPIYTCDGMLVGKFEAADGGDGQAWILCNMQDTKTEATTTFTVTLPNEATLINRGEVKTLAAGPFTMTLSPGDGAFLMY
ncbi:MAG: hypothetical protein LBR73_01485 [Oscillospiraceae bacterium]|jgi:hypothetical protein|nr:hypothetical protein [Oscillospiraceae bacterium]